MDNIKHIHNINIHHDFIAPTIYNKRSTGITVTSTATSDWIIEENFSMAMDDHHRHRRRRHDHHINPITPLLFDPHQVWPNIHNNNIYLHNNININSNNNHNNNHNNNINIKPSLEIIPLKENEIVLSDDEEEKEEDEEEELGAMKEMMYRYAVMQPVDIDPSTIRKPKRRNVRISNDPQSVAARHRRERISEKIRILQRLVPGGTKLDTASMLDEAVRYVKFLKKQIRQLQRPISTNQTLSAQGPNLSSSSGWDLVGQGNKGLVIRDHFQIEGINNNFHHQGN